jgi:hypothetical protein
LLMLKTISMLRMSHSRVDVSFSYSKYVAMLKWSLGLRRPLIEK